MYILTAIIPFPPFLQSILESAWSPTFNTALLDALGGSHSLLADL
jgi:hypothetical protein